MNNEASHAIAAAIDDAEVILAGAANPPQPPEDEHPVSTYSPPSLEIIRTCAKLDQNDTDNGKRLIAHFGADILFVREIGAHIWNGTHWDPDGGQDAIERYAQEVARRIKLESGAIMPSEADAKAIEAFEKLRGLPEDGLSDGDRAVIKRGADCAARLAKKRADRYKFAVSCGNRARTVAMIAQAQPHRSVAPAALDSDPMAFNVQNGTLIFRRWMEEVEDLECPDPSERRLSKRVRVSASLIPHDRERLIAKIAPFVYDKRARCPHFFKFLRRMQPDRTQRRFLQTAVGRAMIGGATTQALIFLYGDGANGKSVFMEVIAELLGAYAGRLKPETITGSLEGRGDQATPDIARLAGKRFVAIAELGRGAPLRESLVKTMTGGEPMPARHLNKGFFDLVPEFIPFMSGNDLPEVGGLDHGIWRRLKFVHWPVKIPPEEQRPLREMVDGMLAEAPGILNWAIEGALRFLRDGLRDPPNVTALTAAHREDLDPVGAFLTACVRTREGSEVQARSMFEAFVSYCEANAIRAWKETAFGRALKKKGLVRDDKRIRRWVDVELFDVPHRPEPRSPYD
ncbi:phage/plasmid primase, P4 family [Pseudochelatococcus sp. G4_1912]|uniref:DNA primase family protein n=1 Tax=Pseudochelatococcus sp. G4_1912 TaxID=3114288 RepID=UPI0039C6EDA3